MRKLALTVLAFVLFACGDEPCDDNCDMCEITEDSEKCA